MSPAEEATRRLSTEKDAEIEFRRTYPVNDENERMAVAIARLLRARGSIRDRRHDMCELRRCLVRLTGSETYYHGWDRVFRAALACEHEINGQ